MSEAELRKVLNFNEADLNANRAGQLTPKQIERLARSDQMDRWIEIGLGIVYLAIPIIFTYTMILPALERGLSIFEVDTSSLLIVGILWLVMGGLALSSFMKSSRKRGRSVQKAEGLVRFAKVERRIEEVKDGRVNFVRNEVQYDLHVGQITFNGVDERLMNIMRDDDHYVAYYVNGLGLLSAELVRKGK